MATSLGGKEIPSLQSFITAKYHLASAETDTQMFNKYGLRKSKLSYIAQLHMHRQNVDEC